MEKYRVDTDKIHATVVQAWEVSYTDAPCDVLYTQKSALDRYARPNAHEMISLVIVRHDDESRNYLRGAVASRVAKHLAR